LSGIVPAKRNGSSDTVWDEDSVSPYSGERLQPIVVTVDESGLASGQALAGIKYIPGSPPASSMTSATSRFGVSWNLLVAHEDVGVPRPDGLDLDILVARRIGVDPQHEVYALAVHLRAEHVEARPNECHLHEVLAAPTSL
jgi:hypothetical protein